MLIIIILTLLISFFIWIKGQMSMASIPDCTAITHTTTYTPSGKLYVNLIVNLLTLKSSKIYVNLKGNAEFNGVYYNISRNLEANYHYSASRYHLKEIKTFINPSDDVKDQWLNNKLPATAKDFFIEIKKVNQYTFIFLENDSPLFVCNALNKKI